jgi:hypothetical protein
LQVGWPTKLGWQEHGSKFEEVELENEDLDLKKFGLKITKEDGKEGYPVTAKMTKKKIFLICDLG